ncbi:MAG: hypothetical protein ACP5TJ_02270 [Candidatus Micrarchaeia archaeon]
MPSVKIKRQKESRLAIFVNIFKKPVYMSAAVVSALAYYFLFYISVKSSTDLFFITLPIYLLFSLVVSSALVFVVGIFGIVRAYKYKKAFTSSGIACSLTGTIAPIISGIVAGCGCETTFIFPFIVSLGFSSIQAIAFVTLLTKYNVYIVLVMIAINLFLIYYQLGKEKAFS